jgi:hypothetical protein
MAALAVPTLASTTMIQGFLEYCIAVSEAEKLAANNAAGTNNITITQNQDTGNITVAATIPTTLAAAAGGFSSTATEYLDDTGSPT